MLESVELAPAENAKTTLFAFGGIANGIDIPSFEFRRMTSPLSVNKVFVRDTSQSWYQGLVKDPLACFSDKEVETVQDWLYSTRTVFLGNSMGGFAAILFGCLLRADRVLAFSPQTFVSPLRRLRHMDNRWLRQILRMYARYGLVRGSYDLRTILAKTSMMSQVDIFYGEKSRYDAVHAAHLSGLPGFTVTVVPGARHGAAKCLRESGELARILHEACKPEISDGAG